MKKSRERRMPKMIDYESMNDRQVNTNVAIALGFTVFDGAEVIHGEIHAAKPDGFGSCYLNYCNNPSDAWPIIVENKISILKYDGMAGWLALSPAPTGMPRHEDTNPLRAAMIVFLKMQESKL
jgi:hypothetical protein